MDSIIAVDFIKNSLEKEQSFFSYNLTEFSNEGITIQLEFSDPLLISASKADLVNIKLKKDYFLSPNYDLVNFEQMLAQNTRRLSDNPESASIPKDPTANENVTKEPTDSFSIVDASK